MKKTIFMIVLLINLVSYQSVSAQLRVGINFNIGSQPIWGPVGYEHVDYYYLPDIDAYYDVPAHQYIYLEGGRWIFSASLPGRYRNYDLYNGYKVVVNEPRPYRHAEFYRTKYAEYKGRHGQEIIRNSHDSRYFEIKDHPEHDKWKKEHHDNGRGNGRGRNKGR